MSGREDSRMRDMQFVFLQEILRAHVIQVAMLFAYYYKTRLGKRRRGTRALKYEIVSKMPDQEKHLRRLVGLNDADCISNLRMDRRTFARLCAILRERGGLVNSRFVTVEEQIAMFLSVLAHHKKNRVVRFDFWRSGQTISHYVHVVLGAIIRLHDLFLAKPEAVPADCNDPRWRWFKWDARKDKLLLVCLVEKIEECRPTPPHLSPHVLIQAMLMLNSQLHAAVSLNEVEGRVAFLHDRYVCFKYLCKVKETQYDEKNNVIHAVDEVWERLFKENALARAYYHEGEPEFLLLCNLFGIDDVKNELSHTLIIIDDSTTVKKQADSSDDEVTSPVPKPVARKLFVDDACSSVSPSVPNLFKSKVVPPWKALKNKFRRPKHLPTKTNDGGSSCASSSPFK